MYKSYKRSIKYIKYKRLYERYRKNIKESLIYDSNNIEFDS